MGIYGDKELSLIGTVSRNATMTERLKEEKERLERRLADVNAALEVFDKFPEIASAMDAISKIY